MPLTPRELFQKLEALGIMTTTVEHDAAFSVAESAGCADDLPGAHTKNLFVKDAEGTLFLIIAKSDTAIDLKAVAKRLGAGRLSFAKADLLMEVLGVPPGSVTAFAVINDRSQRVRVVFDKRLVDADSVNCHPLVNTATTNIARDDLLRFIRHAGHEPKIAALTI